MISLKAVYKTVICLLISSLFFTYSFATATITTATGGTGISADKSSGSAGAAFTTLGNIVIGSGTNTDFTTGTNVTFVLTAPTNWQFSAGVGSVSRAGNVSAASVVVTANTVTVTYTVTGSSTLNAITISGLQVQGTVKSTIASANITRTSGTGTIAGFTTGTSVGALSQVAGTFTKMQILLPGETASGGSATGKTGTPTSPVAGTAFNVIVNAVDANWNVVTTVTDVAGITSTETNATLPANTALAAGTRTFSVTFRTAGVSRTITASDITTPAIPSNTSPAITASVGAFAKMQILMPGETAAPGTATGKTGTPTARTAGVAFTVTVNAVDASWNLVNTVVQTAGITSNDANAILPANAALVAGTKNFSVTLRTATTTATVTASNITDNTKTANTSPSTIVNVGTFVKLQLILPGETAAPGTTTGKTGTPSAQIAGTALTIRINAVDAAWNVVTSVTDVVGVTSTDVNATLPANIALSSGTITRSFTFKTTGTKTITAKDITTISITANTSPNVTVSAGAFVKLQILLPGETAAPGTATGKTGTPNAQSAGTSFNVTVNAVDANWNRNTTVTQTMGITSTDPLAALPANAALVAGTKTNFAVTLKTPGTATVTASDITDNTKTANTSPSVTVNIGAFVKFLLIMPGESYSAGSATGKTGSPSARTAGVAFTVTVRAVDAAWNTVTSVTDVGKITSSDVNGVLPANAALVSGSQTFSVILKTSGSRTVTATDASDGTKTASTSAATTVNTNTYTQLQILLPGETAAPGTATGATGTANPPARNTAFNIIVNAVDAYYNKVTTVTSTVTITSSDGTAVLPAAAALAAGTRTFSITIKSTSTSPLPTITATQGAITTTVSVPVGVPATVTTDYFRTRDSGNWNDASNWQSSTGGVSWQNATLTPTSAANTITIMPGDTITVTASVTVDQVIISSTGQVNVNSGVTLTIASGVATPFDVSGVLNNAGTITTTGALSFAAGGKYQHNYTTSVGTIPTATWNAASTCEIIGYTSATGTISNTNQSFGNFIYNCPSQNVAISGITFNSAVAASTKNFSVLSTGTGSFRLSGTGGTLTVAGDFNLSGGNLIMNTTSGTMALNVSGNFTMGGGTLQKGTSTASNIAFNGTTTQTYTKTGGTISGAVNFAINSNALVDFGTSVIDGSSGTFTLNSGGTLLTGNDDGLSATGASGSIQTSGTISMSTGANYTYNGDNGQTIGTGLPTTVNNLTIDNSQGATMPATTATYTINGQLSLIGGDLDMGLNSLAVGGSFTNTGTNTLHTQNIGSTPIPASKTWTVDIDYNGPADQTVVPGTYTDLFFTDAGNKVATAGTITVKGNWSSNDGKVDLQTNSATVQFTGTAQLLDDGGSDNGNGVVFKNVTFGNSGTKTLNSGTYNVAGTGVLSMAGTATLAANGNLVMASDSSGNGGIAALPAGTNITGNVNVQTFITGAGTDIYRGTRAMSTPINDAALVNKTYKQMQSYVFITGPGNTANGFDLGGTGIPNAVTLQTYNEPPYTTGIYTPIATINQSATPGKGFYLFFRGDRSDPDGKLNAPFDLPEDVTLTFTGPINKNTITISGLTNTHNAGDPVNGYNFVGNPYASTIDWATILSNSTNLVDQVVTLKAGGGSATYIGGVGNNGGSRYIQTGQGFFVKVLDASNTGSVTFTEGSKVSNTPARLLSVGPENRQATAAVAITKFLRLYLTDNKSKDETTVVFKTGASATSADDAVYFAGNTVSLGSLSSDAKTLAVNFMPDISLVSQLKLSVNATVTSAVKLVFTDITATTGYKLTLKDNYLNKTVTVAKNTSYAFTIDKTIAATYGTERFVLSLTKAEVVLPFQLVSFSLQKTSLGVSLAWQAKHEKANDRFEIERGATTTKFSIIGTVKSLKDTALTKYSFIDTAPLKGANYYRLKQYNQNGTYTYSKTLTYNNTAATPQVVNITAYPNPTVNEINISYNPLGNGSYSVAIYNSLGFKVIKASLKARANVISQNVASLTQGVYLVEITDAATNTFVGRVKFIKN
ncbi:T9SS type A sorting domain-containing protein [Inquilinus sp. KBS0705]|nr:T9SS type A sorting domain-containing protein [Inquilinus sp. KBS0705]